MDTRFLNKLHTAVKGCRQSVYLYAYANLNVGDDLFIHKIVSAYPHIHFVLIAKKPYKQMFSDYRNVTVYEEDSAFMDLCKKCRIDDKIRWRLSHECDLAVCIAGSIFMEDSNWPDQYLWYKDLFDNDRLYFLGCNWGPCKTRQFKENMTAVLSDMKDICFRDRASYDTFSHLPNVRCAPDILLGLDRSAVTGREEKKQVLISVVDCAQKSEELADFGSAYCSWISRLVEHFAELGYGSVLCSFCENEGDLAAAEQIRSLLTPRVRENTPVVNYCGTNLHEILGLIAESEYVVATRFHAMILGLVAGKKVLPLIYSAKTESVLKDLPFRGACYDIRQLPEQLPGIVENITRGISDGERDTLSRLAAGHFDRLNEKLK